MSSAQPSLQPHRWTLADIQIQFVRFSSIKEDSRKMMFPEKHLRLFLNIEYVLKMFFFHSLCTVVDLQNLEVLPITHFLLHLIPRNNKRWRQSNEGSYLGVGPCTASQWPGI